MKNNNPPTFWAWMVRGTGDAGERPGLRRVFNCWILLHLAVGLAMAVCVPGDLAKIAQGALIPLLAVLVALTFSWAGIAHAVLQDQSVRKFMDEKPGRAATYVFSFQLCVLVSVATICIWALPIMHAPYSLPYVTFEQFDQFSRVTLFALTSLSIRTAWHTVLGANMLLLQRLSPA